MSETKYLLRELMLTMAHIEDKLLDNLTELLDFSCFSMEYAKKEVFPKFEEFFPGLGDITTGFIGTVDGNGSLNLYDGDIRLMKPDGTFTGFRPEVWMHIQKK